MTLTSSRAILEYAATQPLFDAHLAGVRGTVGLEVGAAGTWVFTIEDGVVSLAPSTRTPDCVVTLGEDDFAGIVDRRINPLTLFLRGGLTVRGAPDLALAVARLLPRIRRTSNSQ